MTRNRLISLAAKKGAYLRRRKQVDLLVAYKKSIKKFCQCCGKKYPPERLSFHHINPSLKERNLNKWMNSNISAFKKEISKCQILCRKCHLKQHPQSGFMSRSNKFQQTLLI